MGQRIAITGINSCIASPLLKRLAEDQNVERIIGIDVSPWKGGSKKITFFRKDIQNESISELLSGVDVLYHFNSDVTRIKDSSKTDDSSIEDLKNICRACVKNHVKKVIYTSSSKVYGGHRENLLYLNEESELPKNKGSFQNKGKIEAEDFVRDFFKDYPEIILTVLRPAFVFGPTVNNMFSALYSGRITSLPIGASPHMQLIHEDDLGEAMYLCLIKDLPGIYNVGADDAMSVRKSYRMAGVTVLPLPAFILNLLAGLAVRFGFLPADSGWILVSNYTIFSGNQKFKKITGWEPEYSSEETFASCLDFHKQFENKKLKHKLITFLFTRRPIVKEFLKLLHAAYRVVSLPGLRKIAPWLDPKKNSMTYLPVNESIVAQEQILLPDVVHGFIDQSVYHVVFNKCGCRFGNKCEHHTEDVGCLFMGESALDMPKGISRQVTKEEAHAHVEKAISAGLIPMTGKVRVDNDLFLIPDKKKLLSVCFCCHCCCMMTFFKHAPSDQLDHVMTPVEGMTIEVTDDCVGCGSCIETCGFDAIYIENGKAVHKDICRKCGRCERTCPNHTIKITLHNLNSVEDITERIQQYVYIT
ncbi:MAG: epimerase [Desulfobacterium sp.]|nr:epimerase [Desulfobacterium sp.]